MTKEMNWHKPQVPEPETMENMETDTDAGASTRPERLGAADAISSASIS